MTELSRAERRTIRFFELYFPDRSIEHEKQTGYYYELVERFTHPNPTHWMDTKALQIYKQILHEELTGKVKD